MTLEGIDLSHHQPTTPDLSGVDFVIARATYGATPDRKYAEHAAAVRAAGKVLGAYHFARPVSTGDTVEAQVSAFLAAAPDADLWVIDREADGDAGPISRKAMQRLVSMIRATGRRVGLYASEAAFEDFGQDFAWVARWGSEPSIPWDLWQYDNGGRDGIDNNRFRGTRGALLALGAPLREWVDATSAALNARVRAAEAEVTRLGPLLDHAETMAAEFAAEIEEHAAAHRAMRAFEEAHP